ncbi:glycosyltransferase [Nocardioides litoris]|uniref:glycosyltransferase n=1 Tax=Nocardioides litoris TaxID=1926648 RepID=UPI001B8734AC|nr:glycosyltransferase [Nocardioides litoris]
MKVAIAHDYVTQRGGAERVVLAMLRAFPDATLHTLLYDPGSTFPEFRGASIVTSPLNRLRPLRRSHRASLPLLPLAASRMRVEADVVLASSSGWAHGFDVPGRLVVYCHAPARWLYQPEEYLGDAPALSPARLGLRALAPGLRRWDQRKAARGDVYLANSTVVRDRVRATYGREAEVLAPPFGVDTTGPREPVPALEGWSDYHLVVSRLLPYKNVDVAMEAFRGLPLERLVVVGAGPERDRLLAAAPPNVRLVQDLSDAQLRWVYAGARALVAPSHEDFGLTPLEAAAFGKPTIALRAGGYLDTVDPGRTGIYFDDVAAADLRAAVGQARTTTWQRAAIAQHAESFSEERFARRLRQLVAAPGA